MEVHVSQAARKITLQLMPSEAARLLSDFDRTKEPSPAGKMLHQMLMAVAESRDFAEPF